MIVCMPGTICNLSGCTLRGNETNYNSAIIASNADLFVSESSFREFKSGAIYSIAKPYNRVMIKDCEIREVGICGVYCQGEGSV